SAFAGQIANLRNGFSIHFDRKEQTAESTRLFTSTGYLDIATDQITSFEEDEAPVAPEPSLATPPSAPLASHAMANKPVVSKPLVNPNPAAQQVATNKVTVP